jgi:hypothetical protein
MFLPHRDLWALVNDWSPPSNKNKLFIRLSQTSTVYELYANVLREPNHNVLFDLHHNVQYEPHHNVVYVCTHHHKVLFEFQW